jgi:hypothetical protein
LAQAEAGFTFAPAAEPIRNYFMQGDLAFCDAADLAALDQIVTPGERVV